MASPVERLIAMRRELDALIAELQGGAAGGGIGVAALPAAPKKGRGRPKIVKEDLDAAAAAGGLAAEEIEKAAPKRVLSDEHKAKMKAGREAAKARKAGTALKDGMPPALGPAAANTYGDVSD
jgi:hypothetical protein